MFFLPAKLSGKSNQVNVAVNEALRLEEKYSRYLPNSITSKINRAINESITVDQETAGLLNYAQIAFSQSDGLFDITSGVLRKVWNFKQAKLPSDQNISKILNFIGWNKIKWDGKSIQLQENMEVDFGGLVKEYAADSVASELKKLGVKRGYVNLGGDIAVIGPKRENEKEAPWTFGIRDPNAPNEAQAMIQLLSGGLASSGDYERYFELEGKRYCHLLNPKTGWPIEGVACVSVLSENCLTAGTLSTIAMLKGFEAGTIWLKENQVEHLIFQRQ